MSRIYFHTQHDGEVEVWGGERAHLHVLNRNRAAASLSGRDRGQVLAKVCPDHWLQHRLNRRSWTADLTTALSVGEDLFVHEGQLLNTFDLVLNTVLGQGSDTECFLARLDGQCEIHGYIEGPYRAWAADMIDRALDDGLLRRSVNGSDARGKARAPIQVGWPGVVELLHQHDDEPVVMSYSVCDGFPNERVALGLDLDDGQVDDDSEEWESLSSDERWQRALLGLRGQPTARRDLSPDNLRAPFGHSLTLFDLFGYAPQPAVVA